MAFPALSLALQVDVHHEDWMGCTAGEQPLGRGQAGASCTEEGTPGSSLKLLEAVHEPVTGGSASTQKVPEVRPPHTHPSVFHIVQWSSVTLMVRWSKDSVTLSLPVLTSFCQQC